MATDQNIHIEREIDVARRQKNFISNEYAELIGWGLYMDCPKAVFAAIAVSPLLNGSEHSDHEFTPDELIATAWFCLHQNGVVLQPLPAYHRHLVKVGIRKRASAIGVLNGANRHHKEKEMDPKIKELTDAAVLAVMALNWLPDRKIPPADMKSYAIVERLEKAIQAVYKDAQKQEKSD